MENSDAESKASKVEDWNEYPRKCVTGDTNIVEEVDFSENKNQAEVLEIEVKVNIRNIHTQNEKEV